MTDKASALIAQSDDLLQATSKIAKERGWVNDEPWNGPLALSASERVFRESLDTHRRRVESAAGKVKGARFQLEQAEASLSSACEMLTAAIASVPVKGGSK